jgi:hypothetical protein
MDVREKGIRRIRYVTRGLAVAGVAGSVLFAGLAQAATQSARTNTPSGTPTSGTTNRPSTPINPRHRGAPPADQPPVTSTDQPPQITGGGS